MERYLAAVVQMNSGPSLEQNLAQAGEWVAAAAQKGAELVALPENFAFLGEDEAKVREAPTISMRCREFLEVTARRHRVALLGGGFPVPAGGDRVFNTAVLMGPDGSELACYRKVHLFDAALDDGNIYHESATVKPGAEYPPLVKSERWGNLGLSICYDLRFPELYRHLSRLGAEVLMVPAAFTALTGRDHWEVLLKARAVENTCYVLAPAQSGRHYGNRSSHGHAMIVDPWGSVLGDAGVEPSVLLAEINRSRLQEVRRRLPSLRHRVYRQGPMPGSMGTPDVASRSPEPVKPASRSIEAVVAGHVCLDIIPDLSETCGELPTIFKPGTLTNVGEATISPGGSVSNTGIALFRLGVPISLMGAVADDAFGRELLTTFCGLTPTLAETMIVLNGGCTSYTIVINPPGVDRIFLHHPGVNDLVRAEDFRIDSLPGVKIFHFGYPTIMRQMYAREGEELEQLLSKAKEAGLVTSLDLSVPDRESEAGRVRWRQVLSKALPYVDIFLPSLDEILMMLEPASQNLSEMGEELMDMGAAVVGLKRGSLGLYLRTTDKAERLEFLESVLGYPGSSDWLARELICPAFRVKVVGTTGAGDCTIAGFLAALTRRLPLEEAVQVAVAAGACSVEQLDAASGVPSWTEMRRRIESGWEQIPIETVPEGWKFENRIHLYYGPNDPFNHPK